MARPRKLTDEQRKERKKISNNKPEYIEHRRLKSLEYYYRKKLQINEIEEKVEPTPEIKEKVQPAPEIQK